MKYRINLFPQKEKSLLDKIIYFSFNYLRYILVITQIVVIGVFFYRFKVDQEIVDLKDAFSQKQEIMAVSEPLIKEAAAVERKTSFVSTIVSGQQQLKESLVYLFSIFPKKLSLNRLSVSENGDYLLSGTTNDPNAVKLFFKRLNDDKLFTNVLLNHLTKEQFNFSFSFTLKDYKPKK